MASDVRLHDQVLTRAPQPRNPADQPDPLKHLVARLSGSGRATFTRHDLLRAALDVLPPHNLDQTEVQAQGWSVPLVRARPAPSARWFPHGSMPATRCSD